MLRRWCCFLLVLAIVIFGFNGGTNAQPTGEMVFCQSIVISDIKDFDLLRNCDVVVGHVRIVNLQLAQTSPIPASVVEEITDYLLVHRVEGLRTLQRIFPRLKLIRGEELLFDRYSLVVFENRDLENLGLISLLRVQNGAVRIEKNPVLCFVDTVNWVYLLGNSTRQHFSFKNKPSHQCPLCNETLADIDESDSPKKHCWSLDAYQRTMVYGSLKNCSAECGIHGCDTNGDCCNGRCLTGCSDHNCELCATYKQSGSCVDMCSFTYLNKRDCILGFDCNKNGRIPHDGACIDKCPSHYEKKSVNGIMMCTLQCSGNFEIHSANDLAALKNCTTIQGSLTIELLEVKARIIEELEHAFVDVKEITDYLMIKNSPQLVSLQFLRKLHTIGGNRLIDDKYAFYVVNNNHLEHIWNQGQNVAVEKGRPYFHLNPRLCYEKIVKLQPSLKDVQRVTAVDASPNSNGERVICGESIRVLNATVEDFNSTAVRIKVNPMSADDKEVLVGYAHYYKEAPIKNVTRYDGRHGCGHDNWLMDISPNRNIRHVISNLKPYTQYAYFVKTLTMTDYHMQLDAYSEIQYFRTLPSKPGPPAKVYYHTLSTSEIMIHWWPPHSPNGLITSYLIYYTEIPNNNGSDATTNYLADSTDKPAREICECKLTEPFYSGPPPEDENFYNKEQLIYDEALPNVIYVARVPPKRAENKTANEKTEDEEENLEELTTRSQRKVADNGNAQTTNTLDNTTKTNENETRTVDQVLLDYQRYREELERKSLALQDTGIADFPIIKHAICKQDDASVQYQLENNCRSIEHFEGTYIPSHIHQRILSDLKPESSYRISVRACQENGECSGETVVTAKTISKTLEDFFKGAQTLANDIED